MAAIKRVGVIGAGQMGAGIAHVCALAGYEVLVNDLARERMVGCADDDQRFARNHRCLDVRGWFG